MPDGTYRTALSIREYYKLHPWCGMDTPEAIAEHHRAHGMNEYADAFMELVRCEDELSRQASADDGTDIR